MDTFIPAIIDIEASGFGSESYPIEIGVVFADGRKFCRLVKPEKHWTYWDRQAEIVHRISRKNIETNGYSTREIAEELNKKLDGMTLYSDCWTVDKPWLDRLFEAANTHPTFHVRAIEMILNETQLNQWTLVHSFNISQNQELRHRASADAELIQKTWRDTQTLNKTAEVKTAS